MCYFITNKNFTSIDKPTDLAPGPRIIYLGNFPTYIYMQDFEGPFVSIQELKSKSILFKNLCISNPQRAEKIQKQKNIYRILNFTEDNLMITPSNAIYPPEFIKLLDHTIRGKSNSKKLTGIHYFNESRMRIKEITKEVDANGIWEAIIELENFERTNFYEKKSTFFPKDWKPTRLLHECYYAFKIMEKSITGEKIFKSITFSGIPVNIVMDYNKPKSIYPIHISDILKFV